MERAMRKGKCIIGIVGNLVEDDQKVKRYSISQECVQCLEQQKAMTLIVPITEQIPKYLFELCSGFFFPGGGDVHPSQYKGRQEVPILGNLKVLDNFQIQLVREVVKREIPFLAVCRGIQVINVALGGTLIQHVEGHMQSGERGEVCHCIEIEEYSRLYQILGSSCMVNSFHHQSIGETGTGLRVSARAADGIIEAVELTDYPYGVGVEWHPEIRSDTGCDNDALIGAFVEECRRKSRETTHPVFRL